MKTRFSEVWRMIFPLLVAGQLGFGSATLKAASSLDTTFKIGGGADGTVETLKLQANGKILIGGGFTSIDGRPRTYLARLNPNGALDTTFKVGINNWVKSISVQPDGKILIGGTFNTVNGISRPGIARLHADGRLDTSFNPGAGIEGRRNIDPLGPTVFTIALQKDAKILIGGNFLTFNKIERSCIARLNANGTLDTTFNPGTGAQEDYVKCIRVLNNGKIMASGWFTSFNNQPFFKIVRLNSNGSVDPGFSVNFNERSAVYSMSIQPDGKVVIGGHFDSVNGVPRLNVARLNPNGTTDLGFNPGSGPPDFVEQVLVRPTGKVFIAGYFSTINNQIRRRIGRLTSAGAVDNGFSANPNDYISAFEPLPDGRLVIVGGFSSVNGKPYNRIARLHHTGDDGGTINP